MSTPVSSSNYAIGMPDVYFCNTNVTNNTVTTTSAYADLALILTGIANDASTAARLLYTLGNLDTCSLTPTYTTLDHYIVVNGSRTKDKSIITEKNLSITATFDEMNVGNLQRFLMATNDDSTAGAVMENVAAEGSAVLVYKSTYGTNFMYVIPRCALISEGDLAFSGEAWIKGGLKLNVLSLTGFNPTSIGTITPGSLPSDITSAPFGYIQTEASFGNFYYDLA